MLSVVKRALRPAYVTLFPVAAKRREKLAFWSNVPLRQAIAVAGTLATLFALVVWPLGLELGLPTAAITAATAHLAGRGLP